MPRYNVYLWYDCDVPCADIHYTVYSKMCTLKLTKHKLGQEFRKFYNLVGSYLLNLGNNSLTFPEEASDMVSPLATPLSVQRKKETGKDGSNHSSFSSSVELSSGKNRKR